MHDKSLNAMHALNWIDRMGWLLGECDCLGWKNIALFIYVKVNAVGDPSVFYPLRLQVTVSIYSKFLPTQVIFLFTQVARRSHHAHESHDSLFNACNSM